MSRAFSLSLVAASFVLAAGSAPAALAAGAPSLSWVVRDQASGQVIEIAKPSSTIALDGNHPFEVKLVVKDPGPAGELAIGGRIVGLLCRGDSSPQTGKAIRRALPQHIASAPQGQPAEAALAFNGDGIKLCSGADAGQDSVKGGKILIHGSSTDKRDARYQAAGTLTIKLVPTAPQ